MAHEFESGFFTQRPAWHGLGNVVGEAPTNWDEVLRIAGLEWQVDKQELYLMQEDKPILTDIFALVRSTDSKVFGSCTSQYEVLQNSEAVQWCQPLVDTGLWSYETGGALRGGEICWTLLKQDEQQIVPNDVLKNYLMVSWAHNGKRAVTIKPVSIRVVCMNTLSMAMNQSGGHSVRHTGQMPVTLKGIQNLYKALTSEFSTQAEVFTKLVNTKWDSDKLGSYIDTLFPIDLAASPRGITISKNANAKALEMASGSASGIEALGLVGTAYGAFHAVSEFNEHYRGGARVKDSGFNVLFGQGVKQNEAALELAVKMS